ncbi:helix-turn-helix transcriptional regulator [Thermomicrobium sp. CFH 73360]|uniref:helix-turn-helix transcriptional regulator n=1 Tax=Thermomicrobium sp. CFH 73360 TaxID=2951987 RepID=UPI00207765F5|nr:helix-turn-helix transcriptional regulator [Thermomicrobium sp. CFH 73360]MCM8745860.1 helix-turn-helix transcriptional regulator [Thermomicrobium sp. CFH 73360]
MTDGGEQDGMGPGEFRPVVRTGVAVALPMSWILLVPLGPVGQHLAGPGTSTGVALAHGAGLVVVGLIARRQLVAVARWGGLPVAAVSLLGVGLSGRAALFTLLLGGVLVALPVAAAGWELGRLEGRRRAWAVALGAALANLPLLLLDATTPGSLLRVAGGLAGLLVAGQGVLVRPGPLPVSWPGLRSLVAVGACYLAGGLTYGMLLPGLGGGGVGVVPYLLLLPLAAVLAGLGQAGPAVRAGLFLLALSLVGWVVGRGAALVAATAVGCWAFLDVGWWTRLGEERGWGRAYPVGLGVMVLALGLGIPLTTASEGLVPTIGGPLVAMLGLLGAALLVPSDPASLVVREEQRMARQVALDELDPPGPGRLEESAGLTPQGQKAMPPGAPGVSGQGVLGGAGAGLGDDRVGAATTDVPLLPVDLRQRLVVQYRLSRREADVLELALQGLTNKEIALQLGVRIGTVRTHLERAYRKLGVASRVEAAWLVLSGNADQEDTG